MNVFKMDQMYQLWCKNSINNIYFLFNISNVTSESFNPLKAWNSKIYKLFELLERKN